MSEKSGGPIMRKFLRMYYTTEIVHWANLRSPSPCPLPIPCKPVCFLVISLTIQYLPYRCWSSSYRLLSCTMTTSTTQRPPIGGCSSWYCCAGFLRCASTWSTLPSGSRVGRRWLVALWVSRQEFLCVRSGGGVEIGGGDMRLSFDVLWICDVLVSETVGVALLVRLVDSLIERLIMLWSFKLLLRSVRLPNCLIFCLIWLSVMSCMLSHLFHGKKKRYTRTHASKSRSNYRHFDTLVAFFWSCVCRKIYFQHYFASYPFILSSAFIHTLRCLFFACVRATAFVSCVSSFLLCCRRAFLPCGVLCWCLCVPWRAGAFGRDSWLRFHTLPLHADPCLLLLQGIIV